MGSELTSGATHFQSTSHLLTEHFDGLIACAGDVPRLNEAVLQLAVQGNLVAQDPNDEPASELLKRIAAEKKRLGIKSKPLPEIGEEERPFILPDGWEWVRLGTLSENIHYGYTASADFSKQDYRLLRITDIQNNKVDWPTVPGCEIEEKKVSKYLLKNDDILIARTGGTIGKSYIVENISVNAVFASYLIRIIPSGQLYARYIKLFVDSPLYWTQLTEKSKGTGQPNVNATSLSQLQLPLPPLTEQKRIVTRVNALLHLCDDLAAHLQEAQSTHTALRDTVLDV